MWKLNLALALTALYPAVSMAAASLATDPVTEDPLGVNALGANDLGANSLGVNALGANDLGANSLGMNPLAVDTSRAANSLTDCSATAKAVFRACRNEAEDDYWIAIAKCLNLTDADERDECLQEAWEERAEQQDLCNDQRDAREDVCEQVGPGPYDPEIDPEDFLSPEEAAANPHPYFPLVPGAHWVYAGGGESIEVTVTEDTKEILGVTCFVVRDVVEEDGELVEDTDDYFALDVDGNVWYMGELSKSFEDGELESLDGSWKSGVDGAKPGIVMEADPEVGDVYRQEFLVGDAEDLGEVLSVTATESAPGGSCDGVCVVTKDFTPIEPGHLEHKYYAPGIGLILEVNPETGERVELVEYEIPAAPRYGNDASGAAGAGGATGASGTTGAGGTTGASGTTGAGGATGATTGAALRFTSAAQPNPLQVDTTIGFELARDRDVSADVIDASGRRVRSLVDAPLAAGQHRVLWNGTDGNGRRVASGVYFVRVRAGGNVISRTIVVAP